MKSVEKIDWNNNVWKHDTNLKIYIRQYGNPNSQLNGLNTQELIYLAKCTEKARVLIDTGKAECSLCQNIVDNCECFRCNECFSTICECVKKKK